MHGEPDASIRLQLQRLGDSVYAAGKPQTRTSYEVIAAKAAHEMIGLMEMQENLRANFDFSYLQQVLGSIVNSQANHNKHLVYLLNKQLNRNNVMYLRATEHHNEINNIKNILGNS